MFIQAARLTVHARQIRDRNLQQIVDSMLALPCLPTDVLPKEAKVAAVRAVVRMARWLDMLDTCLVRSLVVGTLLSDRDGMELHIGFRRQPAADNLLEGHAWVSCRDEIILDSEDKDGPYRESVTISMRRK